MKRCNKCKKEVANKDWDKKKCVECGNSYFEYCTKDGSICSNGPVYDG